MKVATRNIMCFFFILLVTAPLLVSVMFTIKKRDIHLQMRERLEYSQLQTVVLPAEEVVFMDKHEIWVNERMFDIHSKKLKNGIYTFTGLYDEDETELVKHEKKIPGKDQQRTRMLSQLFKSLPLFCQQPAEIVNKSFQQLYDTSPDPDPINQSREILTPPPQA